MPCCNFCGLQASEVQNANKACIASVCSLVAATDPENVVMIST